MIEIARMKLSHNYSLLSDLISKKMAVSVKSSPQLSQINGETSHKSNSVNGSRRTLLLATFTTTIPLPFVIPAAANASQLGQVVDQGWEKMGGGPSDLTFPLMFKGIWDVRATLVNIELPLGTEMVLSPAVVQRAQAEDLNQPKHYQVSFRANSRGEVVPDRRFNTASLLSMYLGSTRVELQQGIQWNLNNPNELTLKLPQMDIMTRVTKRSEESVAENRLQTSEYVYQLIEKVDTTKPTVKASRCFTKYLWREEVIEGQPQIVATQVVSDYITPEDNPRMAIEAAGTPSVVYTYRLAFTRAQIL
jgi:hypothetical protein